MAENPYINKVVFGNDTLVDLTNDSVEASNLLEGETAHDRSGAPITGTAKQGHVIKDADGTSMTQRQNLQFKGATVTDDSANNRTVVEYQGGGLLPHLVITADSGETVTATKGGTTLTATETSTGIYEVDVTSYGTWTVSDGTNSNTVNVDSVKVYEVAVVSVPDGSTVTPTDDISIWLACGQRSETYTTLAEVLADSTCLSALMADSNAVDYLVRSKSFIGNEALVPTMTSNTTPSGVVSASSYSTNYEAWKAFNTSESYGWSPSSSDANNPYIQYEFPASKSIYKVVAKMTGNTTSITYTAKILCGSTELDDVSVPFDGQTHEKTFTPTDGQTFKLRYDSRTGSSAWINGSGLKVQFYSYGITANQNAMTYIGLNNYASNTLLADSDWCAGICNSTYFESVLNVKVPTMTSNTTPSGVASASGTFQTGHDAFKIFDKNNSTWWCGTPDTGNQWVKYDFGKEVKFYRLQFNITTGNAGATTYPLHPQISSDDVNWDGVFNETKNLPITGFYNMTTPISGRYVRIYSQNAVSGGSQYYYCFNEFNAYGREDV